MITPQKFLDYSKRILSNSSIPEEEARTAISRAYYSLYHEALNVVIKKYSFYLIKNIQRELKRKLTQSERARLNQLDQTFLRKFNFHLILSTTFIDIGEVLIANSFKDFRHKRNQADYDLKLTFTHSDADTIVNGINGIGDTIVQLKSL